jgi:hypothetical protein
MKEYNDLDLDSNNDINKNFNIDKALNQQNIENNNEQNKDINKTKNKKKNKIPTDNLKKKGELNFKKWLLTLSSIGNMILGALLLIMALSAMRYKLDSIFIADKGLIVISIIIILSSILCFIGLNIRSFHLLILAFYNYILTIVFLSVFSLGAVSMNKNLVDWIDTHWDIIRSSVHNYDMNKFKDHVTTEINSLGIFSLTLIAIVGVSMACIINFLKMKNIIFVLAGPINLIFACLSIGQIVIGFYVYQNAFYGSIPRWSCVLIIILGFLFTVIGIFGWRSVNKMKKSWIVTHLILLFICFVGTIFATIGIFNMSGMVYDHMDEHWEEISNLLNKEGYQVRKSYMVNQLIMQLKLTGFYLIAFIVFNGISFCTSFYIFYNFSDFLASAYNQKSNYFSNDLSRNPSHFQSEVFNYNKEIKES